jgi:hypothetical protein
MGANYLVKFPGSGMDKKSVDPKKGENSQLQNTCPKFFEDL